MENLNDLLSEFDAQVWAREFCKLHGGDESLMLSWFACALMAGYEANMRSSENFEAEKISVSGSHIDHFQLPLALEYHENKISAWDDFKINLDKLDDEQVEKLKPVVLLEEATLGVDFETNIDIDFSDIGYKLDDEIEGKLDHFHGIGGEELNRIINEMISSLNEPNVKLRTGNSPVTVDSCEIVDDEYVKVGTLVLDPRTTYEFRRIGDEAVRFAYGDCDSIITAKELSRLVREELIELSE